MENAASRALGYGRVGLRAAITLSCQGSGSRVSESVTFCYKSKRVVAKSIHIPSHFDSRTSGGTTLPRRMQIAMGAVISGIPGLQVHRHWPPDSGFRVCMRGKCVLLFICLCNRLCNYVSKCHSCYSNIEIYGICMQVTASVLVCVCVRVCMYILYIYIYFMFTHSCLCICVRDRV